MSKVDKFSVDFYLTKYIYEVREGITALVVVPWYDLRHDVTAVVFDSSFAVYGVRDMSYWFYSFTMLAEVSDIRYVAGATGVRHLLNSCSAMTGLDLRGFSLGEGTDMYMTFGGCSGLLTMTVNSDWVMPATLESNYATFYNCTKLVGGNGTKYSSSRISAAYMVIDSDATPGYLTAG